MEIFETNVIKIGFYFVHYFFDGITNHLKLFSILKQNFSLEKNPKR